MALQLFEDQAKGIDLLVMAIREQHKKIVYKSPTGSGKTVIASWITLGALAKSNKVIFAVDAISLIDQTIERFESVGIDRIGVVQATHPRTDRSQPVQICSIATLERKTRPRQQGMPRRYGNIPHADIVIVDEAHAQYKFVQEWKQKWSGTLFIGLSATPWAKGMAKHWDTMVIAGTIRELILNGRLCPYVAFGPSHPDLSKVRVAGGDYVESDLSRAMSEGALVARCVDNWIEKGEGRPTLAFCVDRKHASKVVDEFIGRGIPVEYIDAFTKLEERAEIRDRFHAGKTKIVVSVGCLTKGVDWDVRCILLLRPTKSEMLYVQMIGRGLRTAKGKDHCLILDHSDTITRLGYPEEVDERNTSLNGYKKTESRAQEKVEPKPKVCPRCSYINPPKTRQCIQCGFVFKPQSDVLEVEAGLAELVPADKKRINRNTTGEQKGAFYAGLKMHAQRKGYKPSWADANYREKFGVWPQAYKRIQPAEPNEMVKKWIKYKSIKYRAEQSRNEARR